MESGESRRRTGGDTEVHRTPPKTEFKKRAYCISRGQTLRAAAGDPPPDAMFFVFFTQGSGRVREVQGGQRLPADSERG